LIITDNFFEAKELWPSTFIRIPQARLIFNKTCSVQSLNPYVL
jgi:hypothetical protein